MSKQIFLPVVILSLLMIQEFSKKQTQDYIGLVAIGSIEEGIMKELREVLKDVFPMAEIKILKPMDIEIRAFYDPNRRQYHSSKILKTMRKLQPMESDKALGIIDVDLYVSGLNFVFGEASPQENLALISLTRLRQEFYGLSKDDSLFLKRTVKEAVHELGHLYGLAHCPNPKCVMYFSNSILDTDRKDFNFCIECKKRLID